jgi:hypothetical protein
MGSVSTKMYALGFAAEWLEASGDRRRAAALWSFIAAHPHVERADREDARQALERLQLDRAASAAAAREAQTFGLDALVDTLMHELVS